MSTLASSGSPPSRYQPALLALPDITLAASKGIDAFALNVGADNWQATQVANAYSAAHAYNAQGRTAPFKLFLSFDMTSLPCGGAGDIAALQRYIAQYARDASQVQHAGRALVSTFGGEACAFGGAAGLNDAWTRAVKPADGSVPPVWFVPSFLVDPKSLGSLSVIDGALQVSSIRSLAGSERRLTAAGAVELGVADGELRHLVRPGLAVPRQPARLADVPRRGLALVLHRACLPPRAQRGRY